MEEEINIKRICVIDGQGGGIGSAIIKRLREVVIVEAVEILALGTNAIATSQMLKAGANRGASGENAIVHTLKQVDIVIGPIGIIFANAMMGEVTPQIAQSVSDCGAKKLLLPLSQENVEIIGVSSSPLPHLIEEMIEKNLKEFTKPKQKEG
jgi:NAD(P)-dependent dehydrogenase (short-subunit alcohol dehydrogenase family)